jgi:hypothetical protein
MRAADLLAVTSIGAHGLGSPWFGYASIALVLMITIAGIWVLVHVARHEGSGDDDDSDRGEDPGGGGPGVPSPPSPRPDGDPDWWPEFERAFASHVASLVTHAD